MVVVTPLRTNQTPRIDWRREAPPINSWFLIYPKTIDYNYKNENC
jgi:hypothetical protein